ncbi:DNA-binding NarL/FixJ family response regulator [Paenibacillus castaneae]|uniref:DUF6115 domain-containing protein n=1 Tax=Paenibacillus castaneae TaxID=474957 RepID=UPI000C9C85D8|nr:hypothetical protein [Paenibacillus castaneae]NIK75595.1 DNA-binding NarL/FixJ family response regulator [Paenibacillus castaneae]
MEPYFRYILLLGAVVIVSALMIPRKKPDAANSQNSVQNMENALELFMENMEKENESLVLLVKKAQEETKSDAELKERRIIELERKCEQLADQLQQAMSRTASFQSQIAPTAPLHAYAINQESRPLQEVEDTVPESLPSNTIQSRYSELFDLYNQGKSIEMIAKKLSMNKGEVQLIIGLAKQEEAANV